MKIKHKVVKEFQYLSPDKKIFILKAGTILEEYKYKVKTEIIPIDRDIIDNNPEFFEIVDWKAELLSYIKTSKLPTPAVLTKKLVPFIEDMILSSIQQNAAVGKPMDDSLIREIERKELDLKSREKRIKDKEEEIDIRIKRVEKREIEHKDDLKSLDKREDDLRERSKEVIEKGLDLDDKIQELNEKERNLDRTSLESTKEIDDRYVKLQAKIDLDLKALSEKEKELENGMKSLKSKEEVYSKKDDDISDLKRDNEILKESLESMRSDILQTESIVDGLESYISISKADTMFVYPNLNKLENICSEYRERIDSIKSRR
jgi:DNA repair exonuclease SbcCD ATPase subunit